MLLAHMLHNRDVPLSSYLSQRMQIKECFAQVTCQMARADGYHLRLFPALRECMFRSHASTSETCTETAEKNVFNFLIQNIPNLTLSAKNNFFRF